MRILFWQVGYFLSLVFEVFCCPLEIVIYWGKCACSIDMNQGFFICSNQVLFDVHNSIIVQSCINSFLHFELSENDIHNDISALIQIPCNELLCPEENIKL